MEVKIILYLPTKAFIAYTSTCCTLYALALDQKYQHHFDHRREKKKFILYQDKFEAKFEKVIEFFNTAIEEVDLYAHDQHTCYNEAANGTRTHDMPKHKTFPSTAMSRTAGARLKFNKGVGGAKELIHKNLGLAPNRLQAAEWKRLDGQRASTKKRRATDAFRKHRQLQGQGQATKA
jgi:hypothetical protein